MKKFLNKNNLTRWNIIYNMIKSYNQLSNDKLKAILKLKRTRRSSIEILYYATNEFQSNEVTSSLIYPTILYLKKVLLKNINSYSKPLQAIRRQLFHNICSRFGKLMYNDVFCFATFFNPQFGPDSFPSYERDRVLINSI